MAARLELLPVLRSKRRRAVKQQPLAAARWVLGWTTHLIAPWSARRQQQLADSLWCPRATCAYFIHLKEEGVQMKAVRLTDSRGNGRREQSCRWRMATHAAIILALTISLAIIVLTAECFLRFNARAYGRDMEVALAPRSLSGHTISGLRGRIHVSCYAAGQPWRRAFLRQTASPIVLLVHGLGSHSGQFDFGANGGLVAALVAAGFAVIAPDLWGHGSTDGPDIAYSPKDFLEQLRECTNWAIGDARAMHVLGFSHGAFVALVFASMNVQRTSSLCLTAPYACDLATELPFLGAPSLATLFLLSQRRALHAGIRALVRTFGALCPELMSPAARQIRHAKMPVLIVVGSGDYSPGMRIVSHAMHLQTLLPKARLRIFPHCGHSSFFFGRPELRSKYRYEVVRFLMGVANMAAARAGAAMASSDTACHRAPAHHTSVPQERPDCHKPSACRSCRA